MPQIVVLLNPQGLLAISQDKFDALGTALMEAVEKAFGIKNSNDAAFDVIAVLFSRNKAPVQIEVRYTVGKDVYEHGKVFNPSLAVQKRADEEVRRAFAEFSRVHGVVYWSPSVWFKPYQNSWFSSGQVTEQESVSTHTSPAPSIYKLPLTGNMLSILSRRVTTIPELLQLDPMDKFFWGFEGTRVYTIVALIELDYTENDGQFLSKEKWANSMRSLKAYRFVCGLNERGKLSDKFKRWFNDAIKDRVFNQDNRPSRKIKVQPFQI